MSSKIKQGPTETTFFQRGSLNCLCHFAALSTILILKIKTMCHNQSVNQQQLESPPLPSVAVTSARLHQKPGVRDETETLSKSS